MNQQEQKKPSLHTVMSPALLDLYDLSDCTVVIIDVLRATSTIATALYNGAKSVIPVDSVQRCIELGKQIDGITAGERDGQIAEGLSYGNSPFEYSRDFIQNKTLVLTTTNGTRLLHMALERGADTVLTGAFVNVSIVADYLKKINKPVILGCAAWKNRINLEDSLLAGALIDRIGGHFSINCDASQIAWNLYDSARQDLFEFIRERNASHYHRLMNFGLEKDIRYCLSSDAAPVLPIYRQGRLIAEKID